MTTDEPVEPTGVSQSVDQQGAASATEDSQSRRRVRLNPTFGVKDAAAVPSLAPGAASAPKEAAVAEAPAVAAVPAAHSDEASKVETQPAVAAEQGESQPAPVPEPAKQQLAAQRRASEPVEVPKETSLDADLEAEIEAAMRGADLSEATVVPVAADGGEEEASSESSESGLEPGTRLKGKVQTIGAENVFIDLGTRFSGMIALRQFPQDKPPQVGQELDVLVEKFDVEEGVVALNLPRGRRKISGNWDAVAAGQIVDCLVAKTNKGGLEVTVSGLRGFLPAGQVDLHYVGDLEPLVGQKLTVQVMEANPKKRNLVVSRRAVLMVERKSAEDELWKTLAVGQRLKGRVKTVKEYGAFIDLGGADGFLRIGEISWQRIKHVSDVLKEGQEVEVSVVGLDTEKRKISLGMRQLFQNPWLDVMERISKGTQVKGKVTRTTEFGAFVELEPGIEGLIHISELDHKRVRHVKDVLTDGQEVEVQVLEVDPERQRISLSLKALKPSPQQEKAQAQAAEPPPVPQKPRSNKHLKGGTGESKGGGLFGNPRDFH